MDKKLVIKMVAGLLAALLLLVSCGGTPAATTTAAQAAATTAAAEEGLNEVTLNFYFFDMKKSATDQVWNKISEEFKGELNAKFNVQFIAGSDYSDKILTMSGAGEKWDLNFDGDWLSYFRMANLNGYLPLNDLMPKYAPDLYKAYQSSGVLNAAKVRGDIVAMPWSNIMNNRPHFLWRGDLIDIDEATINTIDDVGGLLYKLKDAQPGKYYVENVDLNTYLLKYNMIDFGNNFVYDASNSKVTAVHKAETKSYRERAVLAEKWQKDGLIWADVLIDNLDHNMLINQGQLLTKFGTYEFSRSTRAWVEPDAHWNYHVLYNDNYYQNRTALANLVAIPRTAENPERTLMFLNLLETSQKMYDLVHYGIEGVTYVLEDNGKTAAFPEGMDASNSNYQLWQGRWGLWKPQFMRGDFEFPGPFWQEEKAFAESNPKNIVSALDGFNFDPEPVTVEFSQVSQIYEDAEKMLNVGLAGAAEAAVDKLIADMKNAGLDKITAEMQKQVDAFLAN